MIDPDELRRIEAEARQQALEDAYEKKQQQQQAPPPPSKADELAAGWDELDIVGPGWNIYSTPAEPGTAGRKRRRW